MLIIHINPQSESFHILLVLQKGDVHNTSQSYIQEHNSKVLIKHQNLNDLYYFYFKTCTFWILNKSDHCVIIVDSSSRRNNFKKSKMQSKLKIRVNT